MAFFNNASPVKGGDIMTQEFVGSTGNRSFISNNRGSFVSHKGGSFVSQTELPDPLSNQNNQDY